MAIIGQLLMVSVAIHLALCLRLIYHASADWPFCLARNPACRLQGLPVSRLVAVWQEESFDVIRGRALCRGDADGLIPPSCAHMVLFGGFEILEV